MATLPEYRSSPAVETTVPVARAQQVVRSLLKTIHRQLTRQVAREGTLFLCAFAFAFVAVTLCADRVWNLSLPLRIGGTGSALLVLTWIVYQLLWKQLVPLSMHELDLAAALNGTVPGFAEHVANVLELPRLADRDARSSRELTMNAVRKSFATLPLTELGRHFNGRRSKWTLAALVLCGVVAVLLPLGFPLTARVWCARWLLGSDVSWPRMHYLSLPELREGQLFIPESEPSWLDVDTQASFESGPRYWHLGNRPETLRVASRSVPRGRVPTQIRLRYVDASGAVQTSRLDRFKDDRFRVAIPALTEPIIAKLVTPGDTLDGLRIVPVGRPQVTEVLWSMTLPGPDPETVVRQDSPPMLEVAAGTLVTLRFAANEPVEHVEVVWQRSLACRPDSEGRYVVSFTVNETNELIINLRSRTSGLDSFPWTLPIRLLDDRPPQVSLQSLAAGTQIAPTARIPLRVTLRDDHQLVLAGVDLSWNSDSSTPTADTQPSSLASPPPQAETSPVNHLDTHRLSLDLTTQADRRFVLWDPNVELSELPLQPGTTLQAIGFVVDNRLPVPHRRTSPPVRWLVVTGEELLRDIRQRQQADRRQLETALRQWRQATAAQRTTPLQLPMLRAATGRISRQVWQSTAGLTESYRQMEVNRLGSEAERSSLKADILQPLERLHRDTLGRLRVALDPAVERELIGTQVTDDVAVIGEELQGILSRMLAWEGFTDVIQQLDAVLEWQQDNLDQTRDAITPPEGLFDE